MRRILLALLVLCGACSVAAATAPGTQTYGNWYPTGNTPSTSITNVSSAHLWPSVGPSAKVCNTGSVDAYINPLGTNNTVTATTNSFWLPHGTCQIYNLLPSNTQYTYWAGITASGSTTIYVETGQGQAASLSTGASGGGGGGSVIMAPILVKSANYTVTVDDVASGFLVINANAGSGAITITVPPALGSSSQTPIIYVRKTDTSINIVSISDGTNVIDLISAPATSGGQINGWRDVQMNGTNLRSAGVG